MIRILRLAILFVGITLLLTTGCSAIPSLQPTATSLPPTPPPAPTVTPFPTPEPVGDDLLIPLVIWLPPQFNPDLDNTASQLLKARLEQFRLERPHLDIQYRIKGEDGNAGLLGSLTATSKVATQALPDLVLFPDEELWTAYNSSLIYPFPMDEQAAEDPDWFALAATFGKFQEQTYSLPMAVDGLIMVYNTRLIEEIPQDWDELLRSGYTFSFPAADPEALFTHALYLSANGQLAGEENGIIIQPEPLAKVLGFYSQAGSNALLPADIAALKTDSESWDKFIYGGRQVTVTWTSRYLTLIDDTLTGAPLLTENGTPITLVHGWGWALTNPDPNKQLAAAELARYLTDPEFSGQWTQAAHLLPLRPSALFNWPNLEHRGLANQLMQVARSVPLESTLNVTGKVITQAVIQTLTGELTALEAAELAASSIE